MNITSLKKNNLFVGRAATAIYLILKNSIQEKEVILPSNICYAAVYPIIYSNNKPVFVDIDTNTGNAVFEEILKKINKNTGAIIFPYMYGNISTDIIKLKDYCNKNNIILIEDCASAMGAKINGCDVGTFGDYSVFSTGHAKIVDVGNGGILVTDKNIDKIEQDYKELGKYNNDIDNKLTEFSKKYRKLRNENNNLKLQEFFSQNYKEMFIYKLDEQYINKIKNELEKLNDIIIGRKENFELFKNNLDEINSYKLLKFAKGSVPWRLTLIIENKDDRKNLIKILLDKKLFVSDWYPCIAKSFSSNETFPNSEYMEERILNFSLTDSKENILQICETINEYFRGKNK